MKQKTYKSIQAKFARKKRIQPIGGEVTVSHNPYRLAFTMMGLPPNANASGGSRNFWAIAAEKKIWMNAIDALIRAHLPRAPLHSAKLILTRQSSVSPDPDGIVGSFKVVIDAMVKSGVLENDKWENIGMPTYQHVKVKPGLGGIVVEVAA